jgi:hypothetical protein
MTSRQHQDWINHGKPDSGLALPLQLMANTLAAAGYTVYVYPNDAHLDAQPPEDHTYYSETGWPHASPKWWRHAIDIMPGPAGKPSLQAIGQSIFNARQTSQIPWIKYMNWPSDGNLSHAVQDRWEPDHSRGSSSDTGHIHLSCATGCETLDSSFNPLTSVVVVGSTTPGTPPSTPHGDDMSFLAYAGTQFYLCASDGTRSIPVTTGEIADLRTLRDEGLVIIGKDAAGHSTLDWPRGGWTPAFGPLDAAPASATVDVAALAASLEAAGVGVVDVNALATALAPHLPTHITLTGTTS